MWAVITKTKKQMKTNLLLILILISIPAFSQKTKKVTIKSDNPSTKEIYYVLKSDEGIKHGKYSKEINGRLFKQGQYENNEETGVWEYFDLNREVTHKIDIDNNKVLYDKSAGENSNFDSEKYLRPLILLGGFDVFFQQIAHSLRYPPEARRNGTQGKVYLKLFFNNNGLLENVEVIEGVGDGLDEEAVRVIKLIDIEALPALDKNGNPTTSEMTIPISFRLG